MDPSLSTVRPEYVKTLRVFMRIMNFEKVNTLIKTKHPFPVTAVRYFSKEGMLVLWERFASGTWGVDLPYLEAYLAVQQRMED